MSDTTTKLARASSEIELTAILDELRERSSKGEGEAAFMLAMAYDPAATLIKDQLKANLGVSEEQATRLYGEAYAKLQANASAGNGEAMHLIAMYYQMGIPPVERSEVEFLQWNTNALNAGFLFAANDLYTIYGNPSSRYYDSEKAAYYLDILERSNLLAVSKYTT